MNKNIFRLLVLVFVSLTIIALLDALVLEQQYPKSAVPYLEWFYALPRSPLQLMLPYIGLFLISIVMLSSIGMMLFNNIARHVFTIATIFLAILDAIIGLSLGVPQMFTLITIITGGIASYIVGAIIALSYWSNISENFVKRT